MTTGRSLGDYEALGGRIYTPDEQNTILFIVQGIPIIILSFLSFSLSYFSFPSIPPSIYLFIRFCFFFLFLSLILYYSPSASLPLSLSLHLFQSLSLSLSVFLSLCVSLSLSFSLSLSLCLSVSLSLSLPLALTLYLLFSLYLYLKLFFSFTLFLPLNSSGGWYLMIVCGQAAHIWVCRTTTVSIFTHGVFSNWITNFGVFIALGLGCFVTYTPGIQIIKYIHTYN